MAHFSGATPTDNKKNVRRLGRRFWYVWGTWAGQVWGSFCFSTSPRRALQFLCSLPSVPSAVGIFTARAKHRDVNLLQVLAPSTNFAATCVVAAAPLAFPRPEQPKHTSVCCKSLLPAQIPCNTASCRCRCKGGPGSRFFKMVSSRCWQKPAHLSRQVISTTPCDSNVFCA